MESEEPKDLGIKIGTPTEALWTRVKDTSSAEIKNLKEALIVQKAFKQLAEEKIAEEQKKS